MSVPAVFAVGGFETILFEAFLIYTAAKVLGQIAVWLKQPSIVGELVAGVLIGPAVLGWISLGEFQEVLAELGVILLLFTVGLETRFSDLRAVGPSSSKVAMLGIVLPFGFGWGAMVIGGYANAEALFIGTALVATSVGITAEVLKDLGKLGTKAGRVILGAAVIDDILGLALLAVVSGVAAGDFSGGELGFTLGMSGVFVVFLAVVGTRLMRRYPEWVDRALPDKSPLTVGIILCLGLSAAATRIGMAAIIGAFMAGMVLAEARERYALDREISQVTSFLTPFFFVVTGAKIEIAAFGTASTLGLVAILTVLAVAGKVLAGVAGARALPGRDALVVGVGMVPRGEVGIIVATIGLSSGIIGEGLYAVAVAVALLTTVAAPPVLAALLHKPLPTPAPP